MRKHAIVLTLTLLQIVALLLTAFFCLVMRPDLAATYGTADGGALRDALLPLSTRIALLPWVMPVVGGIGAMIFAAAWTLARGANLRNRLLAASLVWTVLGLGWAIWAAYEPAFEQL
ncbi:MAG: hypothetical protein ABW133_09525 [Polyangiaceae bacterium]